MRAVAIYLVMFNHTGTNGFFLFSVSQNSPFYAIYLFLSVACKPAVPLYFMISGALLLSKEESLKDLYQKRILKYTIILILASAAYHVYNWYYNGTELSLKNCFITMYSSTASVALWYLYSYIGALMMLPLLRKMVRLMEPKDYFYMAACQLVISGVIPILQYLLSGGTVSLSGSFSAPIFTASNVFYLIMGYFFEHVLPDKYNNSKSVVLAVCAYFLAISITCFMTYYKAHLTGECSEGTSQTFYGCLISIPTFSMYFCSKCLFKKITLPAFAQRILQFIGGTTLGIYLLEGILRNRTISVFWELKPLIHTMPACLIWILVAYVMGIAITAILKKIPFIKRSL